MATKKIKDAMKGKKKAGAAKNRGKGKDKAKDDVCVLDELVVEERAWCCDDECCCLM